MTSGWADLDRLAVARPRPDGRATLIARDDRTSDAISDARHLSTVLAISRVVRGQRAIAERHDGRGVVIYATREAPPSFLVDAVSAAGGVVFDGTREHTSRSPLATTVQLDAAFCDLASMVRRRFKVGNVGDALDVLEHELRRRPIAKGDVAGFWTAICELAALAGELVRADRPARWIEAPGQRFPLALELGAETLFPAQLAQAIVEGSTGTMRALVKLTVIAARAAAVAPVDDSAAADRPMPLLCDRKSVPLDHLTWSLLVSDEVDHPDLPVIVWVDDQGEGIRWPTDQGPPTAALQQRALTNLASLEIEITPLELPFGIMAIVTGDFFAAEMILDRPTMKRVREALGASETILVGTPVRGHLVAIDAVIALADDRVMTTFLLGIEREYLGGAERDRISSEAIVYHEGPLGRVQSNLMDTRRALRRVGVDPDA